MLVGLDTSDDAGVYRLNAELAIVQTVDFFTPIVDDPYLFGQIAATNALSDIYAMGAKPLTALNIVAFPINCIDEGILQEVLRGGADKVREAEAVLIGGHTIEDNEPKFGLAVTGVIHPDRVWTNAGARPGDVLVLTKPLGTGIIASAVKGNLADVATVKAFHSTMTTLNKQAAELARRYSVSAATDITGFGLLGHAYEMAAASNVTLEISASKVPLLPQVIELAEMGLLTAGGYANQTYIAERVEISNEVPAALLDVLFDPQTSGGLLLSLPGTEVEAFLRECEAAGQQAWIVGRVRENRAAAVSVV